MNIPDGFGIVEMRELMMTITLTPVTRDDVKPLVKLTVAAAQENFVAPNAVSLAQAHYETGAYPFVIWAGDKRVGLIQVIDFREHDFVELYDDPTGAYLWRLSIGQEFQAKGYGKAALLSLLDWARERGNTSMTTSAVPKNAVAINLYESLGFDKTGRMVEGEIELKMPL